MKKLFILIILAFWISGKEEAYARRTEAKAKAERKDLSRMDERLVKIEARREFQGYFKNVSDTKWEHSTKFDKAIFVKDGSTMTAYYDHDSHLVGTMSTKTTNDLPEKGLKMISKKYHDYTIGSVLLYDNKQWNPNDLQLYSGQYQYAGPLNYFVELSRGSERIVIQVDPQGNIYSLTSL